MVQAGIVDLVVPEGDGLPLDPERLAQAVMAACVSEIRLIREAKSAARTWSVRGIDAPSQT